MNEDLLMDNGNKNNLKKPLIYGAAAFLVFIVAVIGFAIFNNTKKENNQIVPTENKPQEIAPAPVQNQNNTDFQPLEVEENAPKINKEALVEEKPKPQEKKPVNEAKKPEKVQVEKETKKPKEEVKKTATKPAAKVEKQKSISKGNYYIQVAALLKHAKPNKKFLQIIKNNGFNYTFYTVYINKNGEKIKVTKVLIGPFKTKEEAKKALIKVKQKITQNAFIFKVK